MKIIASKGSILGGIQQVIKGTIFAARDVLGSLTGVAIKFKPWEATKLAGAVSKWAGPVGALISLGADGYKAYKASELEKELQDAKDSIANLIKSAFKDVYDILSADEKMLEFFAPQLKGFEKIVSDMKESAELIRTNQGKIAHIQQRLNGLALLE